MVRLLMEAGADARKGIWPHRDATSALAIARDREYHDVVAVIQEAELRRRQELSCPNTTISPLQDQVNAAIAKGDSEIAMSLLNEDPILLNACDRDGATPLHIAAEKRNVELVSWLLDKGVSARKQDLNSRTPLDRAVLAVDPLNQNAPKFRAIAKLLLERGADLTVRAAVAVGDLPRIREFIHTTPVSYTHLDVYKRQAESLSWCT